MGVEDVWAVKARSILKAELKRRDVSYQQLASKLAEIGVEETPASIANKISRGKFTAAFLLQCLEVIECVTLRLREPS